MYTFLLEFYCKSLFCSNIMYCYFGVHNMSPIRDFTTFLKENTFNGENYRQWEKHIFNLLAITDHKFVLIEEHPPEPLDDVELKEPYKKLLKTHFMVAVFIRMVMDKAMSTLNLTLNGAKKTLDHLDQEYSCLDLIKEAKALNKFGKELMDNKTMIFDHLIKKMQHIYEVEVHMITYGSSYDYIYSLCI